MRSIIVLSLIVVFILIAFLLNKWLQNVIKPRKSLGRLFFYFLLVLAIVFLVTFSMILIIGKLYPAELIK
jgi:hypothetical protein